MADLNEVDADLDEKIIHQVEYYFGNFNFPKDKFLQEQIKLDDGWIPLSTMLNFKRLAALTTDQDRIICALKKSTANLIEVDEEQKKIRRSVDKPAPLLTESRQKEIQSRTVYCKGFSKDNASLDKLLEYFKQFGSVENVQMRTYLDKASKEHIFKGSVFVVFSNKELADEFVKKEGLEYEDTPLIIKKQEDYIIDKRKEREDKKKMQKEKLHRVTGKQPKDSKENEENESEEDDDESSGFAKGAVVHLKGIPGSTTWEDIRNAVQKTWKAGTKEGEEEEVEVAYVDYRNGDEEAWVRLAEAGAASLLVQRARHALTKEEENGGNKEETKKEESEKKEEEKSEEKKEEKSEEKKEEKSEEKKEEKSEEKKEEKTEKNEKNEESSEEMEDTEIDEVNGEKAKEDEVCSMKVNGADVEIHVLRGSEESAYLEKAKGAREKKFMFGKSRGKGGRRGGGRRGRGNRGGKRKCTWDSGPASKKVH
ncbi:hypothetical protein J437_LFUL007125 [Ladona fulva]|uniref:Uncharacterized protein n=1 Tax=Ladona fulva TaxID=123851 RepID=A0A8K0K7T3_LADFU|nr:hypothetical protein J437_LFUL007125 [Ladona fulva]